MQRNSSSRKWIKLVEGWKIISAIFVFVIASLIVATFGAGTAAAANGACPPPATDYGKDVTTVNIQNAGPYRIWSHMQVPDAYATTYLMQVDSSQCFTIGAGSAITPKTWTWVGYASGDPSVLSIATLAAGSHTLTLIGTTPNVSVDDIFVTSDTSCTPVGSGANCDVGSAQVSSTPASANVAPVLNGTGSKVSKQAACSQGKKTASTLCKQNKINWIALIILVIFALMAGGGGWYLWHKRRKQL